MTGLKEEVDQTLERIECTEYRFAERSEDIEEAVGNCVTRVRMQTIICFTLLRGRGVESVS